MSARRKEIRVIEDFIRPYGYRIVHGGGHYKILGTSGKFILGFSASPSEPHWYKNVISDLKRYGHCK